MTAKKHYAVYSLLYAFVAISLVIGPLSALANENGNRRDIELRHKSEIALKTNIGSSSTSTAGTNLKLRILGDRIKKNEAKFDAQASTSATSTNKRLEKPLDKAQKFEDKGMMKVAEVHLSILVRRLEAAVTRIEKLQERVSSRIQKMESVGVTATSSKALLVESQTKLATAKAEVKKVSDKVTEIKNSTSTQANIEEVRTLSTSAKVAIGASYDSLLKSFEALKKTWIEARGNATTTVTTTSSN